MSERGPAGRGWGQARPVEVWIFNHYTTAPDKPTGTRHCRPRAPAYRQWAPGYDLAAGFGHVTNREGRLTGRAVYRTDRFDGCGSFGCGPSRTGATPVAQHKRVQAHPLRCLSFELPLRQAIHLWMVQCARYREGRRVVTVIGAVVTLTAAIAAVLAACAEATSSSAAMGPYARGMIAAISSRTQPRPLSLQPTGSSG